MQLKAKQGYLVSDTGFWIDPNDPWMGGAPDGYVETPNEGDGFLEIKCPYEKRDMNIKEIIEHPGEFSYLFFDKNPKNGHNTKVDLLKTHFYYYQV